MVSVRSLDRRTTTIIIALVLAVGTGLLAFNYLSSANKTPATAAMRTVVVATQDIPVRTVLTPSMLTLASRPADAIDPDSVADISAVSGQISLISIPSGSTLSASKVGKIGLGGLPVRIPAGQRAISIALDRVKGVADLIEAGDHVDVIAVTQSRAAGETPTVSTILRNKVVLAMGTALERPTAAGETPAPDTTIETATLAVTPQEAKTLALADLNATLRLALLSPKDQRAHPSPDPFVLSAGPLPAPYALGRQPAAPASTLRTPAARPTPRYSGPPFIDGDTLVHP